MKLQAYYFRQHMYCLVPHQVREDMKWMADVGTDAVSLAILEQDLTAARANVDTICAEAARVGMQVYAVPSRWGGLVAGAPKVPSLFTATHPETWALDAQGRPWLTGASGPMSSIHHAATLDFFTSTTLQMLEQWPLAGIVWDEPKCLNKADFSPAALKAQPIPDAMSQQNHAASRFFNRIGEAARSVSSDIHLAMFLQADCAQMAVDILAGTPTLDAFGCDGRPWRREDGGQLEAPGKVLIDEGPRFLSAARRNGKQSLFLVENHNMATPDVDQLEKRWPEVMQLAPDHLLYYYFPRNLEVPDHVMTIIGSRLKAI